MSAPAAVSNLTALTEGMAPFTSDIEIHDLTLDSREVKPGSCFVALAGQRHNAGDFIADAVSNGAVAVLTEAEAHPACRDVPVVTVSDLRSKLPLLARRFFGDPSSELTTFAITGTNGKTTVAYMIAEALESRGRRCGYVGTLGHGEPGDLEPGATTTPDILSLNRWLASFVADGVEACAIEASSHGLDQERLAEVSCDVVMFTNLGRDHLDYHSDSNAYRQAKERIFAQPGIRAAVINIDDPTGNEFADAYQSQFEVWTCSTGEAADARVRAEAIQCSLQGTRFSIACDAQTAVVESQVIGRINVENMLMTAAALMAAGWTLDQAAAALSCVQGPPGRLQSCNLGAQLPQVFVDYAHTPDSLRAVLDSLRQIADGRVILVFGCGGDRDTGKRALMGQVASEHSDRFIVTSDNPRSENPTKIIDDVLSGAGGVAATVEPDRRRAIEIALSIASVDDTVLIAGKGHERYQIEGDIQMPFDDVEVVRDIGRKLA